MEGVVAVCTRGLWHSRTAEALEDNLEGRRGNWRVLWTHNLPIPEAQNDIARRALELNPEWVWWVEEDIVAPQGGLEDLLRLAREQGVSFCDYMLRAGIRAARYNRWGKLLFSGMGCLLMRSDILRRVGPFETNSYMYFEGSDEWALCNRENGYGGQDIHLHVQFARQRIFPVPSALMCDHLYVERYGERDRNDGCHTIVRL